ncbi:hypothetical protein SDRG_16804 [Saprolegnia diclina VS20]|uniref:Uncharacterized protein n=1 Tax=Saprolegnia diclina (strain VS20) TaxID=1156394 RepID=T0PSW9_SAPDV|nr:hypothetical protein SDRG_16804 [Saprolegnia diclina VS20]EQC25341.1 hypothetical protein SDRG_16804 [Saprolegnia diclina VS20]|eukprot:XP_008621246.1 hypothetical protein SDRG_16804 [Saprolegnia diclina VS20]
MASAESNLPPATLQMPPANGESPPSLEHGNEEWDTGRHVLRTLQSHVRSALKMHADYFVDPDEPQCPLNLVSRRNVRFSSLLQLPTGDEEDVPGLIRRRRQTQDTDVRRILNTYLRAGYDSSMGCICVIRSPTPSDTPLYYVIDGNHRFAAIRAMTTTQRQEFVERSGFKVPPIRDDAPDDFLLPIVELSVTTTCDVQAQVAEQRNKHITLDQSSYYSCALLVAEHMSKTLVKLRQDKWWRDSSLPLTMPWHDDERCSALQATGWVSINSTVAKSAALLHRTDLVDFMLREMDDPFCFRAKCGQRIFTDIVEVTRDALDFLISKGFADVVPQRVKSPRDVQSPESFTRDMLRILAHVLWLHESRLLPEIRERAFLEKIWRDDFTAAEIDGFFTKPPPWVGARVELEKAARLVAKEKGIRVHDAKKELQQRQFVTKFNRKAGRPAPKVPNSTPVDKTTMAVARDTSNAPLRSIRLAAQQTRCDVDLTESSDELVPPPTTAALAHQDNDAGSGFETSSCDSDGDSTDDENASKEPGTGDMAALSVSNPGKEDDGKKRRASVAEGGQEPDVSKKARRNHADEEAFDWPDHVDFKSSVVGVSGPGHVEFRSRERVDVPRYTVTSVDQDDETGMVVDFDEADPGKFLESLRAIHKEAALKHSPMVSITLTSRAMKEWLRHDASQQQEETLIGVRMTPLEMRCFLTSCATSDKYSVPSYFV